MIADDGWCVHHERVHGPQEFGDLCEAWEEVEAVSAARRPHGWWLKRITVCWWLHHTWYLGHGVFYSRTCRSCFRRPA